MTSPQLVFIGGIEKILQGRKSYLSYGIEKILVLGFEKKEKIHFDWPCEQFD
jgi:hypothetical protein